MIKTATIGGDRGGGGDFGGRSRGVDAVGGGGAAVTIGSDEDKDPNDTKMRRKRQV